MSNATQKLIWKRLIKIKPRLFPLVGWECSNPAIRTQEAWDLAYETIYEALPPYRDCLCL